MATMESIRAGASNPWMKAVFAAIVLVFVFWGVGGAGGPTNQVIAEVNGERITDTAFQRVMRNMSRSQGEAKSDEEQSRMANAVVDELIQTEVLLQVAEKNGIQVGDEEIARYVLQIEGFKDSDGNFSEKLYAKNLKRMGLTQGRFEDQIRDQLTLGKLSEVAWGGVRISEEQVRRLYMETQTEVALRIVRIPDSSLIDDVEIDDATVALFVENNAADIRVRYEADFKRLYSKPKRAQLRQIIVKADGETDPRGRIAKLREQAVGGADFAALATEHSQDPSSVNGGDIGVMSEQQLSPSVAAAVFETEVGGITEILTVPDGLMIAKVESILDAETTPIEDVQSDIARTITAEKGVGVTASAYAERLRADWVENGQPSEDILGEQGLVVLNTPPFAVGNPSFPGLNDSPDLIKAMRGASRTGMLEGVFPVPGGRIVAELTLLQKPDEAKFEADKDIVRIGLEAEARKQWLDAWRGDQVASANIIQHWRP